MQKKDLILRQILFNSFEKSRFDFTQKDLAQELSVSTSTVHNALKPARKAGAVKVSGRGFEVVDKEKLLLLWASHRNLAKDIIYQTKVSQPVREIEGRVPPGVIFGAYSAFVKKYGFASADYDVVYFYASEALLPSIEQRFPKSQGSPNLFILKADPGLEKFDGITPDVQTFVDLWNLPQWYAKDFLNDLRAKLGI